MEIHVSLYANQDSFNEQNDIAHMNMAYWADRIRFQGVTPPVKRTEYDMDVCARWNYNSGEILIPCVDL